MKQILRQSYMIIITIGILIAVLLFNHFRISAENNRPIPVKLENKQLPEVEIVSVKADKYIAEVISYGAASPHYELDLTAQISGQINELNINFESGKRVKKGEILLQIEDSDYRAAVASAENNLASAKLALLEEQRQVTQAEAEWKASGIKGYPDSELVLRQPQLKAAMAAVTHAEANLRSARKDLSRTNVIAPFNALIVERHVSPGAYVQPGTELATLYSTEYMEVEVDLSAQDWNNIPDPNLLKNGDWPVKLFSVEGSQNWTGRVLRIEQHLDDDTRQRSLIIAVDQPLDQTPALYPGTFLKVKINGRTLENLWKLPSSSLSQRGEIWYVTEENTLENFTAEAVFSDSQAIYVIAPDDQNNESQRVLFHPLSSYLKGMQVNAIEKVNNDGE